MGLLGNVDTVKELSDICCRVMVVENHERVSAITSRAFSTKLRWGVADAERTHEEEKGKGEISQEPPSRELHVYKAGRGGGSKWRWGGKLRGEKGKKD
jgi:hypothetical protein